MIFALLLSVNTGCRTTGGHNGIEPADPSAFLGPGQLNVGMQIQAVPDTPQGRSLAAQLPARLESALLEEGFQLDRRNAMLMVVIDVEVDTFDQTGNYFTLNGAAETRVTAEYDPRRPVLAVRRVEAEGKRTLGESAAIRDLGNDLAGSLGPMIRESVRSGAENLTAQKITITIPRLRMRGFDAYPNEFIAAVREMDGVLMVQLTGRNREARQLTFSILHLSDAFPEGLETALGIHPDLNIRF